MDHAITLHNVSRRDSGHVALGIGQIDAFAGQAGGQRAALDGGHGGSAAAGLDQADQRGGVDLARDHVVGQHGGQVTLHLGLQQRVHRACGQRVEGGVGGCEHGERTGTLQGVDQSGRFHCGNQGGVVLGIDGVVDDVLVGKHFGAADHGIRGWHWCSLRHRGRHFRCGRGLGDGYRGFSFGLGRAGSGDAGKQGTGDQGLVHQVGAP